MKRFIPILVSLWLVFSGTSASAAYYPNSGDFYYNGGGYADSYLRWGSPGPFSHGDVGYEHDLDVDSGFATTCTAWTNLPYGYDDCPTMGAFDPPGRRVASFGSFHINGVAANTSYVGTWTLKQRDCGLCPEHGPVGSTSAGLSAQEVEHQTCWFDNIWCMGPIRSTGLLVNVPMSVGTTHYETWSY